MNVKKEEKKKKKNYLTFENKQAKLSMKRVPKKKKSSRPRNSKVDRRKKIVQKSILSTRKNQTKCSF